MGMAERVVEAGRWLAEAKDPDRPDPIPQGGWKRWVTEDVGIPWSSSKLYIALFDAVEEGWLTLALIAELGQIAALKLAAARKAAGRREKSRNAPV
jgi:hypothetical protein